MNDTNKREAWLQELKKLKRELLEKKENANESNSSYTPGKTYQKSTSGLASKMYEKDSKQSAHIQVLMLALLTFFFETIFIILCYLIFR